MHQYLTLFGFRLHLFGPVYGVGTAIAFLVVLPVFARWRGVPWRRMFFPIAAAIAAGWVAAHFAYTFINVRPWDAMLWHLLRLNQGNEGIAGVVAGVLTYFWCMRRPALRTTVVAADANDALAPVLAVMVFFFKLGCLLNGCCYGVLAPEGWGAWSLVYPKGTPAFHHHWRMGLFKGRAPEESLPTLPAPSAEMAAMALTFVALTVAYRRRWLRGRLMYVFSLVYVAWRNISEFWLRGDPGRGDLGLFSVTQLMTYGILVYASVMIWRGGQTDASDP